MAQLAIKGHKTRGKEVIEILEMLGGKNQYHINITEYNLLYTIREGDDAIIATYPNSSISQIYTLEEFLEKFPYKVGDKVLINDDINDVYTIKSMIWETSLKRVAYRIEAIDGIEDDSYWYAAEMLYYAEPKEEPMENKFDLLQQLKDYFDNTPRKVIEKEWHEYDKYNEIGPSVYEYLEYVNNLRQPKYPKTYYECCDVLGLNTMDNDAQGYEADLIIRFQEMLIARDAYWKIAGEQMGLGKTWEPDWKNYDVRKYCIATDKNIVGKYNRTTGNKVLAFPTEEMRDAFYENFKELINETKELL